MILERGTRERASFLWGFTDLPGAMRERPVAWYGAPYDFDTAEAVFSGQFEHTIIEIPERRAVSIQFDIDGFFSQSNDLHSNRLVIGPITSRCASANEETHILIPFAGDVNPAIVSAFAI